MNTVSALTSLTPNSGIVPPWLAVTAATNTGIVPPNLRKPAHETQALAGASLLRG